MEIRISDWKQARDVSRKIREEVFIREQRVPEALEWDELDAKATHFLAYDGRTPVGCARLMPDGHFGRMAVVSSRRHEHWGSRLLHSIERYAQHELHLRELRASAQVKALPFYQRNGFSAEPGIFDDAGIAHVEIYRAPGAPYGNSVLMPTEDFTAYRLDSLVAMAGWVELMLAGRPRSVTLICDSLDHPLWWRRDVLEAVSRYVRSARHREFKVYLPFENSSVVRHPLVRLQSRLGKRLSFFIHSGISSTVMLSHDWGYLRLAEPGSALGSMNDRATVQRLSDDYSEIFRTARPSREVRRVTI